MPAIKEGATAQEGLWIDLDKLFADYNLQSEVLEFKMKEMEVRLKAGMEAPDRDFSFVSQLVTPYKWLHT